MAERIAVDRGAEDHDEGLGRNPVGLVFRHVFQERLTEMLPPAGRVLDLGCGTGEDALFLAGRGYRVLGLDPAPARIEAAREKARRSGLPADRLRFEVAAAEEVGKPLWDHGAFDAAYSDFGALNGADLAAVGKDCGVLGAGAPLLLSLLGPHPCRSGREGGDGKGEGRRGTRVGGSPLAAVAYPSRREARSFWAPASEWQEGFGLGVCSRRRPTRPGWRSIRKRLVLAALEGWVRRWPCSEIWVIAWSWRDAADERVSWPPGPRPAVALPASSCGPPRLPVDEGIAAP